MTKTTALDKIREARDNKGMKLLILLLSVHSAAIFSYSTRKVLNNLGINRRHIGFTVIDIEKNRVVLNHNGKKSFPPASVAKMLTADFALNTLGETFQFKTELLIDGKIDKGVLKGNIYLRGEGDPLLSIQDLVPLVMALQAKGINEVEGHFYVVSHNFPQLNKVSDLGTGDQKYNPGLSGLNIQFNRYRLLKNEDDKLFTIPQLPFLNFYWSEKKFRPTERFVWGKKNNVYLSKENKYYFPTTIPVKNPMTYTGYIFKKLAQDMGVTLPRPQHEINSKGKIIATHKGQQLIDTVKLMLEYSNNLIAESILVKAALSYSKSPIFDLKAAATTMIQYLKKNYPKTLWQSIALANGSGLSIKSLLGPEDLAYFLAENKDKKYQEVYYPGLLSLSGVNGWIRRRFKKPSIAQRIFAKTGSLDYVAALAGYFFKNGRQYSFSVFYWDPSKRKQSNSVFHPDLVKLKKEAPKWKRDALDRMDLLIENWFNKIL